MPVCHYEKVQQCPYERSHLIVPDRMAGHLVKCRKSHPNTKVRICPFSTSHHVKAADYERHIEECDRKDLSVHMKQDPCLIQELTASVSSGYSSRSTSVSPTSLMERSTSSTIVEEEDWETDCAEPYDPVKRSLEMNVIRQPRGLTPSERRAFRDSERRRLRAINEREQANTAPSSKMDLPTSMRRPIYVALPRNKASNNVGTLRPPKFIVENCDGSTKENKEDTDTNCASMARKMEQLIIKNSF